jgi:NAD dependent epimerase/dehydratase
MSDWNGKKVLVTGADGFIGSHLAEELLSAGATVRALTQYNPYGRIGWLSDRASEIEIISGDIRDSERVAEAVSGIDVVFHLAALVGIPYSYDAPDSYIQTNIVGTYNVLTAARRHGVSRMIQTSTSEVYGSAIAVPINEGHPLQPQSPYSASKIGADMLALSFYHSFELPVAVVRPFNTYGPRQSARAVIPAVLGQILSGAKEIKVGSTSPRRDFNYVTDTARGFMAVAQSERALGNVVNIGSGREVTIAETIQIMLDVTGRDVKIVSDDQRIRPAGSEVNRLMCDNSRALEWTGWKPEVTLEEGLRRTAVWIEQNLSSVASGRYQV